MEIGGQSEVATMRRVLVKAPAEAFVDERRVEAQWRDLRYTGRPDLKKAAAEHQRLVDLLRGTETEVLFLPRDDEAGLDSIYVRDAMVATGRGVVLCNMGKPQRRGEPQAAARYLEKAKVPIAGRIEGEGRLEGGDVVFLDERTVAVGEGYRTNAEGIRQLRALLGADVDEVVPVPLPHWNGPDDVLHLMSLISPIDIDLALVTSRLLPVPFRSWLLGRGTELL